MGELAGRVRVVGDGPELGAACETRGGDWLRGHDHPEEAVADGLEQDAVDDDDALRQSSGSDAAM